MVGELNCFMSVFPEVKSYISGPVSMITDSRQMTPKLGGQKQEFYYFLRFSMLTKWLFLLLISPVLIPEAIVSWWAGWVLEEAEMLLCLGLSFLVAFYQPVVLAGLPFMVVRAISSAQAPVHKHLIKFLH